MDITHISAYAQIVGQLSQEHGLTIRETLNKISKPWESDLQEFFLEDCSNAQIPVPELMNLDNLLSQLYKLADETGE